MLKCGSVYAGEPAVNLGDFIKYYEFLHTALFASARLIVKQGVFFLIRKLRVEVILV
jgi:hypothetical protein